ncbi:hypothetical protein ACG2OD_32170 [Streptomyces sp. PDY-4]|uniref:Uncharacterized protein n=1 Tax=Streptomyces fungicidicus TaxID=68203 RepID=A0A494UI45_9ACTN|nr:hypothetical protein [Streptomyces fungicidicus]AYL34832.1 hypothetical protein CNQ36_04970 [Streptomyces fungicidicus]
MPKTVNLTDAQQQLTAATATVDQLKAKLLDEGPGSVTAEELGTAALAVEHAKLTLAHAAKQAEDQAAAERLENLQLLKAQILEQAGDVDQALDAMRQLETAAAVLIEACAGRQQLISQATAAMRRAAVPRHNEDQADQHAGLAWSDAGMGRSDELHIDGRRISNISAGVLIAAALHRAMQQTKRGPGHLAPIAIHSMNGDLINDPQAWLNAMY